MPPYSVLTSELWGFAVSILKEKAKKFRLNLIRCITLLSLRWRHNDHDSVSNHSPTVVYSTVYSDADQSKHQSSASLAFVWGIHRDRWIPRTKGQLRGKCFHLMTSSWCPMLWLILLWQYTDPWWICLISFLAPDAPIGRIYPYGIISYYWCRCIFLSATKSKGIRYQQKPWTVSFNSTAAPCFPI